MLKKKCKIKAHPELIEAQEELLRNSDDLYSYLAGISPEAIIVTGRDLKVLMANMQAAILYGYNNPKEMIGSNCLKLIAAKDRRLALTNTKKTLKSGSTRCIEYTFVKRDGSHFLGEFSSSVVLDDLGQPSAFIGVIRDITERKMTEKALQESEERFQQVAENARVWVWEVDSQGLYTYVSSMVEEILGYKPEELIGKKHFFDLFHQEDSNSLKKLAFDIFSDKKAFCGFTNRNVHKDGHVVWLLTSGTPVFSKEGEMLGYRGADADITKRKQAQEAQLASEKRFILAFENAKDAIFWSDPETGLITNCNKAAEFLLEKEKESIIGQHQTSLHPPDKSELYAKIFKEHVSLRGSSDSEADIVTKTGKIKPVSITATVTLIEGKPVMQGIFRDMTEKKKAERERELLNRKLVKSNRQLKRLSLIDAQTGLFNHRYFEDAIEREFCRAVRETLPLSLIMLDFDYFKSINDAYGHRFGDIVLKQFAKILKKDVRRYDIAIRFGGAEFMVISPGADRETALSLAQRIFDSVSFHDFGNKRNKVKLKLSVSVATYPEDEIVRSMDLLEVADQVLNKVKEDGGGRIYTSLEAKTKKPIDLDIDTSKDAAGVDFLKNKIFKLTKQTNQSLIESVSAFAKTIEAKDSYTGKHTESTVKYATVIARALELPSDDIESIREAAVLHDLGKVGISEKILRKKSKLTESEFREIKKHPRIAVDIIRPIHILHDLIPSILHHHERWDGGGYPDGLKKERIPIGARIIAVADTFHALISDRSYRKAFSEGEAIEIIKESSGSQFDPKIVELFVSSVNNSQELKEDTQNINAVS
ncbi:PAS domain S-box protein [Thermoproteota archaeon]